MYRRSQLGLILAALVLAVASGALAAPRAVLVGTYEATATAEGFGGLSALEVTADGEGFIALSDSARLFRGRFRRDGASFFAGRARPCATIPSTRSTSAGVISATGRMRQCGSTSCRSMDA